MDAIINPIQARISIFFGLSEHHISEIGLANLGNMMLAQAKENGDPRLYGIDNGVHLDFITNSTTRTAYLSFIHRLFSMQSPETAMASHIVQSIHCGFTSTADN